MCLCLSGVNDGCLRDVSDQPYTVGQFGDGVMDVFLALGERQQPHAGGDAFFYLYAPDRHAWGISVAVQDVLVVVVTRKELPLLVIL